MNDSESTAAELETPSGWKAKFKGERLVTVVAISACVGVGFFALLKHDAESKGAMDKIEQAVKDFDETQKATMYVLSLSQDQRERLNLSKPRKISEMQR